MRDMGMGKRGPLISPPAFLSGFLCARVPSSQAPCDLASTFHLSQWRP